MKLFQQLKTLDAPFLSHHPLCSSFKDDLIIIKGWKLCLGCTISYPITLGILLGSPWLFYGNWDTIKLLEWGIPLGLMQILSTFGLTKFRLVKVIIKISLGIGTGLTTIAILTLHLPWSLKILIFICCIQIASIPAGLRTRNIRKKCIKCPYKAQWNSCPGYINTRHHTGNTNELPIFPPGDNSVVYPISKDKDIELPVPLK